MINRWLPCTKKTGLWRLDKEEFPRPQTTPESLAELEPSFAKLADIPLDEDGTTFRKLVNQAYPDLEINHVHHAGNSSGVVDGAAALLLASEDYAEANGLKARAKVRAIANMGDSPTLDAERTCAGCQKGSRKSRSEPDCRY